MRATLEINLEDFDSNGLKEDEDLMNIDYICFNDGCLQLVADETEAFFYEPGELCADYYGIFNILEIDPETGDERDYPMTDITPEEFAELFKDAKLTACTIAEDSVEFADMLNTAKVKSASASLYVNEDITLEFEAGPEFVLEVNW